MPTIHSSTFTNREESDLTDAVTAYNAPLLLQTPVGPTLTNDQYWQQMFVAPAKASMAQAAKVANLASLHTRLDAAGAAADKNTLNRVAADLLSGGY